MRRTTGCPAMAVAAVLLLAGAARAGVSMGVIEEPPEVEHARLKERAETYYRDGMRAMAEGNTERAVRMLLWVAKMSIDSPYPQKAFEELKKQVDLANRELAVARELVAGEDLAAGLKELGRIRRVYMGLGPAKEAGRFLLELERNPRFQQALRVQRVKDDFDRARGLVQEAEALLKAPLESAEPAVIVVESEGAEESNVVNPKMMTPEERRTQRLKKLTQACEIYERIARQVPDTDLGKDAARALKQLHRDEDLAAQIQRARLHEKAREWFNLASNYYRAGRPDIAKEYCRKILADCPDAPQAREARAMLDSMTN